MADLKPASFAQKLWRFCADVRVGEEALIEPLHEAIGREDRGEPGEALRVEDISTRLEIVSADGKARRLDVLDGVRLSLDDWR